jgi:hypothetical protein
MIDRIKRRSQMRLTSDFNMAGNTRKRINRYPATPHAATGAPNRMENLLCATVSQLIDLVKAQKL